MSKNFIYLGAIPKVTTYIDGQQEQIQYRGYTIILLGRVECASKLVWHYEIFDASGRKASYGGNPSDADRDIAIQFAQNCVDEYIHNIDQEPQEPDVDDSLPGWADYYSNEADYWIAEHPEVAH